MVEPQFLYPDKKFMLLLIYDKIIIFCHQIDDWLEAWFIDGLIGSRHLTKPEKKPAVWEKSVGTLGAGKKNGLGVLVKKKGGGAPPPAVAAPAADTFKKPAAAAPKNPPNSPSAAKKPAASGGAGAAATGASNGGGLGGLGLLGAYSDSGSGSE